MEITYIIEICVAIIIALLSIAYPIIVDKTSNIGEKYNSEYIPLVFDNEYPQRKIKIFNKYNLTLFQIILYITLLLLLCLIFKAEPLFGWDNFFINNSAKIIVLTSTIILMVTFFNWLNKVVLFNGSSIKLLKYIIGKYKVTTEVITKQYCLKAINEMTLYAINKQDSHIQKDLLHFYSELIYNFRQNHNSDKPLIYPFDIYEMLNRLSYECVNSNNKNLLAIQHRAVSGNWLFQNDFLKKEISTETYRWMWNNITIIYQNNEFIKMFWQNSFQYFKFELEHIYPENYDFETNKYSNQNEIDKRITERNLFLEFHYALGGLMIYCKNSDVIKSFFSFTQSQPPEYVLLPNSMTEIFENFDFFRNEYRHLENPIEYKYPYPGLDGLSNRRQVSYWICRYIVILFLRQYTLQSYYTYQNFSTQPNIPEKVNELNSWLESINYFKFCLNETIKDNTFLEELNLLSVLSSQFHLINSFITELEERIKDKIGQVKLNAAISEENVNNFLESSEEIIGDSIEKFINLNNNEFTENEDDLKLYVKGSMTLMSKSAFTVDDIPHMNYDSIFAQSIVRNNIEKFIPSSFLSSRTERYLLNRNNLINGINEILKSKKKNAVIIVFNPTWQTKNILTESNFNKLINYYPSSQYKMNDFIYILDKKDLPKIKFLGPTEQEEQELKLIKLNKHFPNYNIFGSVIDINLPENKSIKEKYINNESLNNQTELQILLIISFLIEIRFPSINRKIIQLNINTEFDELGSENDLSDLKEL